MRDIISGIGLLLALVLTATLPFHYLVNRDGIKVFPKEHLTLWRTFVTDKVVDFEIDRYNEASIVQRSRIEQEYFVLKLFEYEVIHKGENEE